MAKTMAGKVISTGALVLAGVGSIVATAYGITVAYLMGAEAQAGVDQSTPAPPIALLRTSVDQLRGRLGQVASAEQSSPIEVNEAEVEVIDA